MFKVGDIVRMAPMWKYESATGTVIQISKDYVVVKWNGINGDWHYTEEQAKKIEVLDD